MVAAKTSYEECRLKRLEENKKRMEALNIANLSQALRNSPSPKPSPMKNRAIQKKAVTVTVRRSGRVANLPTPIYKEVVIESLAIRRRVYRARNMPNGAYASEEDREEALEKAEKLESSLEAEYPTFVKSMLPSHVAGGFWLGLPSHFCKNHLPKSDAEITLVDEDGEEHPTVYLARKIGLSGGWRGFAIAHELVDGDALVFQLVQPTMFKVHIIRVNGSEEDNKS